MPESIRSVMVFRVNSGRPFAMSRSVMRFGEKASSTFPTAVA